jgi:transcriptional regulator with XRE-family HTH domain
MSELVNNLLNEFEDEEYRYSYDEDFSNSRMAAQIKVVREQRGLTQSRLAQLAGMKQTRISALENVNYSSWSVSTLRRLARALGVRFSFKFEGWGELIRDADRFSRSSLQRPTFQEEFSKAKTKGQSKTTVGITEGQENLPFPPYLVADHQVTSPSGTGKNRSEFTVFSGGKEIQESVLGTSSFSAEDQSATTGEYKLVQGGTV